MSEVTRQELVRVLVRHGIRDQRILDAFAKVPREEFVSAELAHFAYEDRPLPIGEEQTISQPYVVAWMAELAGLEPHHRVLEVGCGSGYAAAILAELVADVYAIEVRESLASRATQRLERLGYRNIHVRCGDGTLGWPEHSPYDAILVSAAAPGIPEALYQQLATGGRLILPMGPELWWQDLYRVTKKADGERCEEKLGSVAFVPLIGAQGWAGRRR